MNTETTTVDQIEPGNIFYYPVCSRLADTTTYRVLQIETIDSGIHKTVFKKFRKERCQTCDPHNNVVEYIICLNVVSESIIEYFLPDDKCMIWAE